jgi:hypothetical protein
MRTIELFAEASQAQSALGVTARSLTAPTGVSQQTQTVLMAVLILSTSPSIYIAYVPEETHKAIV